MNIPTFFSLTPNPIAMSFIGCAIINLLFVIYLLRKMNNTITIFWFILFTIVAIIADVSNALVNMSNNRETFSFWLAVTDVVIIIPVPLIFSFGFSFANKTAYLQKLWIVIPLYFSLLCMLFISVKTDLFFSHNIAEATHEIWGVVPKVEVGNFILGIYFLITQIVYFTVLLHSYLTSKDQKRKKQIKIVLIAIAIVIFLITITKGFLPQLFHWPVFPSDIYMQIILVATTVYVFSKYGLTAFNIDSVSEKLLQLIPSSILVLNKNNFIELINPSTEILFNTPKEKLIGLPIKDFFLN